jgi:hypothetical protein
MKRKKKFNKQSFLKKKAIIKEYLIWRQFELNFEKMLWFGNTGKVGKVGKFNGYLDLINKEIKLTELKPIEPIELNSNNAEFYFNQGIDFLRNNNYIIQ